jgi:hypothetical protein
MKQNYEKPMVRNRKILFSESNFFFFCLAQCRRELEEEGDMTEDEILRETANIR